MSETTPKTTKQTSLFAYIIGFILSLILTIVAYVLVTQYIGQNTMSLSKSFVIGIILVLAFMQFIVQLFFFLHLGKEDKPRWNARVLMFAVLVVAILIIGSLWIMKNLNYSHGLPTTETEIINDEGFGNNQQNKSSTDYSH